MTSKPFSFHHKMNKVIQISNLTQPVFELHIWPCPLLVPEGLHRLCAFQCDQWLTQNLFIPGDFSKHFHIIASAKAKRTGVIILFYRSRHWATEQLWLVLVTSSSGVSQEQDPICQTISPAMFCPHCRASSEGLGAGLVPQQQREGWRWLWGHIQIYLIY